MAKVAEYFSIPLMILVSISYICTMPLFYIQSTKSSGIFAVWDNTESNTYFEDRLRLNADEVEQLKDFSERKRLEWLSSRYLLHIMTGAKSRTICTKDEHGKPVLINSEYHISLSHSVNRTAVIASKHSVGIDIQKVVSKIGRIARKFCNEVEQNHIPIDDNQALLYYHIIWGSKECIYKSYGKKKVDFRGHMSISKVSNNLTSGTAIGRIEINEFEALYNIEYRLMEDYMIVTSVEIE